MQTTLRINDQLYREAKAEAAREGVTLTSLIEEALRSRLRQGKTGVTGEPHGFRVSDSGVPWGLTDAELRRRAEVEQEKQDIASLHATSAKP
jgi:hypothetical protein